MVGARFDKLFRSEPERLVYVKALTGHKPSYLNLLSGMFSLTPSSGAMNVRLFMRFVRAEKILFATLDEHMFSFAAIAVLRSMMGRPTAALFLRAQKCFDPTRLKYKIKALAFRGLRRVPKLMVATITPFRFAPEYAKVAHAGVHDPQLWDFWEDGRVHQPVGTNLSEEIVKQANGRNICIALGQMGASKGADFLASLLKQNPEFGQRTLVVWAGMVPDVAIPVAESLQANGSIVIARFISDAELESLYGIATLIWACYAPSYDQASGVFGRALQLGVPVIVREGSLVAEIAATTGIACISTPYNDVAWLSARLEAASEHSFSSSLDQTQRTSLVAAWRRDFDLTISAGLDGRGNGSSEASA